MTRPPTCGWCSPGPTGRSARPRPGCSGCSACTPARTSASPRRPAWPVCRRRDPAAAGRAARRHLLTEPEPGRYAMHDLLRGYATELAHAHDGRRIEQRAALRRLLDHYLHTAHAAAAAHRPAPRTRSRSLPAATRRDSRTPRRLRAGAGLVRRANIGSCSPPSHHAATPGSTPTPGSSPGPHRSFCTGAATGTTGATPTPPRWPRPDDRTTGAPRRSPTAAWPWPLQPWPAHRSGAAPPRRAHPVHATGDRDRTGAPHLNLAALLARQHRHADAPAPLPSALDLYAAAGDQRGEAMTLNTDGLLAYRTRPPQRRLAHVPTCRRRLRPDRRPRRSGVHLGQPRLHPLPPWAPPATRSAITARRRAVPRPRPPVLPCRDTGTSSATPISPLATPLPHAPAWQTGPRHVRRIRPSTGRQGVRSWARCGDARGSGRGPRVGDVRIFDANDEAMRARLVDVHARVSGAVCSSPSSGSLHPGAVCRTAPTGPSSDERGNEILLGIGAGVLVLEPLVASLNR